MDRKDEQLCEIRETGDGVLEDITDKDLRHAEIAVIHNLEYELAKATNAHLISIYQAKMSSAGVPEDELVFEPLPTDTTVAPAPSLFK